MAGISSSSDLRDTHSSQKSSDNRLDSWYASWLSKLISVELSEDRLFDAFGDYSVQEITDSVEAFFCRNDVVPLLAGFTKSQLGLPHDQPNKDKVLMALYELISDAEGLNAVCNAAMKGTLAKSTKFNNWIKDVTLTGDTETKQRRITSSLRIIIIYKTLREIEHEWSSLQDLFSQPTSAMLPFLKNNGYLRERQERCELLLKILNTLKEKIRIKLRDILEGRFSKVLEFEKFMDKNLCTDEIKAFAVGLGSCQAAKYTVRINREDCKVVVMYDCGSITGSEKSANYYVSDDFCGSLEDVKEFLKGTTYTFLILSHPDEDHYNKVEMVFEGYGGKLFTILCGRFHKKQRNKVGLKSAFKHIEECPHMEIYKLCINETLQFTNGTLFEAMNLFRNDEGYKDFEAFKTAAKQIGPKVNFLAVNRDDITGKKELNGNKAEQKTEKEQNKASPIVSLTITNYCNTFSLVCTGDAEEDSLGNMSSLEMLNSLLKELRQLYSDNIGEVHSQAQRFCHLEKHSHYTALMAPHHGSNEQTVVCKLLIDVFKPNHVLVCGREGSSGTLPHFRFLQDIEEKLASTTDVRDLFVVNYYFKNKEEVQYSGSSLGIIDVNAYGTATIRNGMLSCRGTPKVLNTRTQISRIRNVKGEEPTEPQTTISIDLEMVTASNSTKCITRNKQSISDPNDLFRSTFTGDYRQLQNVFSALSVWTSSVQHLQLPTV